MTLADLRRNLERRMIVSARRSRTRCSARIAVTDDEARRYYDAHLNGVHRRRRRSRCARSSSPCPATARRSTSARTKRRASKADADPAARRRRRELREAGRRAVRRAVEGQRRPDRPAEPDRPVARSAQADRGDEGRRRSAELLRDASGLSDPEARDVDAGRDAAVRAGARSRSASACSPTSARRSSRSTSSKLRAQAIIEWKNAEHQEGLRAGPDESREAGASAGRARSSIELVSDDASGSRSGRARATNRSSASSSRQKQIDAFLPTITKLEPLEGSQEEDRLAAVSRLLLRALRSRRCPAGPEVHRRREHRLVRRQAGADSRATSSTASGCSSAASCSTTLSADSRRDDGRGRARPAARRRSAA